MRDEIEIRAQWLLGKRGRAGPTKLTDKGFDKGLCKEGGGLRGLES